MAYLYKGKNLETREKLEQEFDDYDDAEEFARDKFGDFPKFQILDEDDNVEFSDKDIDNELDGAEDMMFPDEDSKQGFDGLD